MLLEQAAAIGIPWTETIAGCVGVTMVVLFLRYQEKKDRMTHDSVSKVTSEFSQTVRDVSQDVLLGMHQMQEHTQTLLSDGRARESKHYDLQAKMQEIISKGSANTQ